MMDAIHPGVMQLAVGVWFDPLDPAKVRSLDKHGNLNMLTFEKGTSKLAQCCVTHTAPVEVRHCGEEILGITVFSLPAVTWR